MLTAALILTATNVIVGLLLGLLVAALVYAVGVYLLHAPQPIVGIVALLLFVLILLAYLGP